MLLYYWLSVRQYDPALAPFLQPDTSGLGESAGEEGCPSGLNGSMVQAEPGGRSAAEPLAAGTDIVLLCMLWTEGTPMQTSFAHRIVMQSGEGAERRYGSPSTMLAGGAGNAARPRALDGGGA